MTTRDLVVDAVVDVGSTRFCPFCGRSASLIGLADEEDGEASMGNELATYRCFNDHEWFQPTARQQIRMSGWGVDWKRRRDQAAGSEAEPYTPLQQVTPIVGF